MKLFKKLLYLVPIALLSACGSDKQSTTGISSPEHIYVLIENGGTVSSDDQESMQNTALNLLHQLTTLTRKSTTRHAQIHLVLTAKPNTIAWSGTPGQLSEQAGLVKSLITFNPTFSDLVMSFEHIQTNIHLTQSDRVRLYWIGPAIHAGYSDDSEITITLPQKLPDLALSSFAQKLTHFKAYNIHADQITMMQNTLSAYGLIDRARAGHVALTLLGTAQTKANLSKLL